MSNTNRRSFCQKSAFLTSGISSLFCPVFKALGLEKTPAQKKANPSPNTNTDYVVLSDDKSSLHIVDLNSGQQQRILDINQNVTGLIDYTQHNGVYFAVNETDINSNHIVLIENRFDVFRLHICATDFESKQVNFLATFDPEKLSGIQDKYNFLNIESTTVLMSYLPCNEASHLCAFLLRTKTELVVIGLNLLLQFEILSRQEIDKASRVSRIPDTSFILVENPQKNGISFYDWDCENSQLGFHNKLVPGSTFVNQNSKETWSWNGDIKARTAFVGFVRGLDALGYIQKYAYFHDENHAIFLKLNVDKWELFATQSVKTDDKYGKYLRPVLQTYNRLHSPDFIPVGFSGGLELWTIDEQRSPNSILIISCDTPNFNLDVPAPWKDLLFAANHYDTSLGSRPNPLNPETEAWDVAFSISYLGTIYQFAGRIEDDRCTISATSNVSSKSNKIRHYRYLLESNHGYMLLQTVSLSSQFELQYGWFGVHRMGDFFIFPVLKDVYEQDASTLKSGMNPNKEPSLTPGQCNFEFVNVSLDELEDAGRSSTPSGGPPSRSFWGWGSSFFDRSATPQTPVSGTATVAGQFASFLSTVTSSLGNQGGQTPTTDPDGEDWIVVDKKELAQIPKKYSDTGIYKHMEEMLRERGLVAKDLDFSTTSVLLTNTKQQEIIQHLTSEKAKRSGPEDLRRREIYDALIACVSKESDENLGPLSYRLEDHDKGFFSITVKNGIGSTDTWFRLCVDPEKCLVLLTSLAARIEI